MHPWRLSLPFLADSCDSVIELALVNSNKEGRLRSDPHFGVGIAKRPRRASPACNTAVHISGQLLGELTVYYYTVIYLYAKYCTDNPQWRPGSEPCHCCCLFFIVGNAATCRLPRKWLSSSLCGSVSGNTCACSCAFLCIYFIAAFSF